MRGSNKGEREREKEGLGWCSGCCCVSAQTPLSLLCTRHQFLSTPPTPGKAVIPLDRNLLHKRALSCSRCVLSPFLLLRGPLPCRNTFLRSNVLACTSGASTPSAAPHPVPAACLSPYFTSAFNHPRYLHLHGSATPQCTYRAARSAERRGTAKRWRHVATGSTSSSAPKATSFVPSPSTAMCG